MKRLKTFESYSTSTPSTPDDHSNYLEVLGEIEKEVTADVEDFLQGWEKNPQNISGTGFFEPIECLKGAWERFVKTNSTKWHGRMETYSKIPVYFKAIMGDHNPFKTVGEVAHTINLFGKSYMDVKGKMSYEAMLQKYLEENPKEAGDVYIPKYAGRSMDSINAMRDIANMGLF